MRQRNAQLSETIRAQRQQRYRAQGPTAWDDRQSQRVRDLVRTGNTCEGCTNDNCNREFFDREVTNICNENPRCPCGGACDDDLVEDYRNTYLSQMPPHRQPPPRPVPDPLQQQSQQPEVNDGRTAGRRHIDSIPDREGPYPFTYNGEHHAANERLYNDLYKITPAEGMEGAREWGLASAQQADVSYHDGATDDGHFYQQVGTAFLDIAVGLDPVTGFGRSAYELMTGNNLITGDRYIAGQALGREVPANVTQGSGPVGLPNWGDVRWENFIPQ